MWGTTTSWRVAYTLTQIRQAVKYLFKISGKRGLVFGDIHYDDGFVGRHHNYWENLIDVTNRIQNVIEEEKPDFVVFVGDLIGVRRGVSTLKDRNALLFVAKFLQSITNCIVVKGNHDYSETSDYEFLSSLGIFKSSRQIGNTIEFTNPHASTPCYIHCVDYGQENEALQIKEGAHNIGIMHNEFYVKGKEQQMYSQSAIELSSKRNFFGLDIILSGHIHTPTNGMIDFNFQDGFDSAFANIGCPSRPSYGELYNHVWYIALEYTSDGDSKDWELGFRQEVLHLKPYEEIFRPDEDYLESREDEDIDEFTGLQKEKLEDILSTMVTTNMGSDDFFSQVDSITVASDEAKGLAKSYLKRALNQ